MTAPPTALVTGATSGIGAVVAVDLATRGYRVLVTGRDEQRGRAAEAALLAAGAPSATYLPAEHSSITDTDRLVGEIRAHNGVLDLLIANAGAMPSTRTVTSEGLDTEIAMDVVGVTVLVDGLLPLLTAAPTTARVVMVTSEAATRGAESVDDPWSITGAGAGMRAYARAKRWKLALAAAYAPELAASGVQVHAASPGPAWTPMTKALTRDAMGVTLPVWGVIRVVQRLSTPEHAARRVVAVATEGRYGDESGLLLAGRRPRPLPSDGDPVGSLARARQLVKIARLSSRP